MKILTFQRAFFAILAAISFSLVPYVELLSGLAEDEKLVFAEYALVGVGALFVLLAILSDKVTDLFVRLAVYFERSSNPPLEFSDTGNIAERVFSVGLVGVVAYLVAIILIEGEGASYLYREDGVLESATSVFYLLSAVLAIVLIVKAKRHSLLRTNLAILALLFFVVGMEEISWGQRIIGFETPEALSGTNIQDEFTLHNVWSISLTTYPALAVVSLLLFVFPLMNKYSEVYRRFFTSIQFPLTPYPVAMLFVPIVIGYLVIGFSLGTPTPLPITWYDVIPSADDEILEFLISFQFFVVAVGLWRLRL